MVKNEEFRAGSYDVLSIYDDGDDDDLGMKRKPGNLRLFLE